MNASTKRGGRRRHYSETTQTCGRCKGEIPAGHPFWHDMSKTPMHPDCVRLKVNPARVERPRFLQDNPVGRSCEGCGDEITEGEKVVHVLTLPWHSECRLRERQHYR